MSLSEIKNKLYKKKEDANLAQHDKSEFDARDESASPEKASFDVDDAWEEKKIFLDNKNKRIVKRGLIWLGVVLGIIGLLVAVYLIRKSSFNESRVDVSIEGHDEVKSGELAVYEINYTNDNWASLKNAVLRINYPDSFKPEVSPAYKQESPTVSVVDLGQIKGDSSGKIVFSGKAYSPKGTLIYIKVDLEYAPANFSSNFSVKKQMGVNVISTPIKFEVMAPLAMASGNAIDYQINYKNEGAEDFENIRVRADFPEGFIFSKSEPNASEGNNIWYVGRIAAGESGKIIVSGNIQGERDTYKNIEVHLGTINQGQFISYNDEKASTKIIASPLTIGQTINNSTNINVNAGDRLTFKIYYKNEGDLRLRNVIVKESLDSLVLDYSTLEMNGGSFNDSTKTIEWKASDHPALALVAPGQGGMIEFSVEVKRIIPVKTINDNNFMISGIARIDSPDIPTPIEMNKIVASNRIDAKLNSKILFGVLGHYTSSLIGNFGPIPPIVGQETSYTISLKAGNVSNDVVDAKTEIVLPTGVVMTGKIYPENASLEYNERINSITWNIGNMQVGEGIISPYREVAFQVKITPSPDQVDKTVDIVRSVIFSGKDLFTGQDLVLNAGGKSTMLLEDPTISGPGWKVAQ